MTQLPILMVNENQGDRVALEAVLAPLGLPLRQERSGSDALAWLGQHGASLVLLDIEDEDLDGLVTAARIRSAESTQHVPILFLCDQPREEAALVRAYARGALEYLVRPLEPAMLRTKLVALLELDRRREHRWRNERQQLEVALREAEIRSDAVLAALEEGITVEDGEGILRQLNASAERLLGLSAQRLGHPPFDLRWRAVADDGTPLGREQYAPCVALRTGQPQLNKTMGVHRPDGSLVWLSVNAQPLLDPQGGKPRGVVSSFFNVTSSRLAREAAELARREAEATARLKDAFLATISHEMRTPLTAILGWTRMLRLGKVAAEPGARALETIERNARLQAKLIEDLLDVQRAASGKLDVRFREVGLSAVVEAAIEAARPDAESRGVNLSPPTGLEELRVFGDPERLQQIVANLLSNAIKFSNRGGRVRVELQVQGDEAVLAVQDNGRGISSRFLPHVFDAFRQEDSSLSRRAGGLGLGLSLVRELVEAHGGSVSADSAGEGLGSTFTVTLPLRGREARRAPAVQTRVGVSEPEPTSASLQGARILVVEDDVDSQFLIAAMLEQAGAKVTCASSAAEAWDALGKDLFDLILSDISMPHEDGYSLIRRLRGSDRHPEVPAAALTANARGEDRERALAAGFQAHIAKPVDPTDLARTLAGLLLH